MRRQELAVGYGTLVTFEPEKKQRTRPSKSNLIASNSRNLAKISLQLTGDNVGNLYQGVSGSFNIGPAQS